MLDSNLEALINLFAKLPSLGPRSAKRLVLHLLKNKDNMLKPLIHSLGEVEASVRQCEVCGNLTTSNQCRICSDVTRQSNILCIVEDISDLWAVERGKIFKGVYHILGGTLSVTDGIGPEELNLANLVKRIVDDAVTEVILATNATVEGQTTAYYIAELLKDFPEVKISRLAHGIPMGSELDYLDEGTLDIAFKTRKDL